MEWNSINKHNQLIYGFPITYIRLPYLTTKNLSNYPLLTFFIYYIAVNEFIRVNNLFLC